MTAEVSATHDIDRPGVAHAPVDEREPGPSWRRRLGALLRGEQEEDGIFRPVRLPLWVDLGISAGIVAAFVVGFVGFFVWLAHTQAR